MGHREPTDNESPDKLEEGEVVDRYRVICEVASGGMATVFLAHHGGLGGFSRLVALKRLHPHLNQEQQFVDMFLDEARLVAEIHHPNVVPTLEIMQSEAGLCLVMEYVEGVSLYQLVKRAARRNEPIDHGLMIRIMLDALAGLHGAHELCDPGGQPRGLVHRDVSPQNILVGTSGRSAILDFGVARASERLANTTVGVMKGKLAYMAPEQVRSRGIDRRTDVFAAGIVLWEALARRRLFRGKRAEDTIEQVLHAPVPALDTVVATVPQRIASIVMKALEREPAKRFQSCAEFASELESAATDLDMLASGNEVGEYVEHLHAESLEARRQVVRLALERSAAEPGPLRLSDSMPTKPRGRETLDSGIQSDIRPPARDRAGLFVLLAVAAAGLIAFGVSQSWGPHDEPSGAAQAVDPGPRTQVADSEAAAPAEPEAVSTSPATSASADALVAEADAGPPVKQAKPGARWQGFRRKPRTKTSDVRLDNPYR